MLQKMSSLKQFLKHWTYISRHDNTYQLKNVLFLTYTVYFSKAATISKNKGGGGGRSYVKRDKIKPTKLCSTFASSKFKHNCSKSNSICPIKVEWFYQAQIHRTAFPEILHNWCSKTGGCEVKCKNSKVQEKYCQLKTDASHMQVGPQHLIRNGSCRARALHHRNAPFKTSGL